MPLYFYSDGITYGYHPSQDEPPSITHNGRLYLPIMRLPRNVRAGDLVLIGDNTDPYAYHRGFIDVTSVDYWPKSVERGQFGRVYEALTRISGKSHALTQYDTSEYRMRCVAQGGITFRGDSSRERLRIYRAQS